MSKWYAKIICTADSQPGIVHMPEYDNEVDAKAYVDGFTYAKELIKMENDVDDPLEEYYATYDQIEPTGEC